jgi:hypothetical protein
MEYPLRHLTTIVLSLLLSFACSPAENEGIQLLNTQEEMQKEVSRYITIGLPVQKARQIMENSKFSCEDNKDAKFSVEKRDENGHRLGPQTIIRGNFLSCAITRSYFIATTTWEVSLLYKNNRVVMIYAVINYQNL